MAEIKSFREYIEEQKLFEDEKPQENDSSKSPVSTGLLVTNDTLTLTAREPNARLDELDKKAKLTRRTYEGLDKFIDSDFDDKNGRVDNPNTMFNITARKSFKTIFDNWYREYSSRIEGQKENREDVARINNIMKGGIFKSKAQKESEAEDRNNLAKRFPIKKETDNTSNGQAALKTEETIDEAFRIRNPFATSSELASGLRNRYSSDRVLTSIARSKAGRETDRLGKKGVYGDLEKGTGILGKSALARMKEKYEDNARAIIAKQKNIGLSYLKRAEKNINDYKIKKKYLRNITDEEYLSNISADLNRAMSVLTDIGRDLQNLMNEYDRSLHKISGELSAQDAKNEKYITGLNAHQAISKYDARMTKKDQKEGEKQEAEDIEKGKAEEREAFHQGVVAAVQKEIEDAKAVDIKAVENFIKELGNVQNFEDITHEKLLKKLETDSERKSKGGVTWTDVDRLASVKAIYALAKTLNDNTIKDFNVGKDSYKANTAPEKIDKIYDIVSPVSTSLNGLVDKTKELLLNPDELRNYRAQKVAEKNSAELNKQSELRSLLSDRAKQLASEFIGNHKNLTYEDIYDRVQHDYKFGEEEYAKPTGELKPEQEAKASAMASYLLSWLVAKKKTAEALKKGLDPILTYEALEKAFKVIDGSSLKKVKNFNKEFKKLLKIKMDNLKRIGAISDTTSKDKPSDEQIRNVEKRSKELEAAGAKDFNGETPESSDEPQPKNIFDYAVQKAKKLQER